MRKILSLIVLMLATFTGTAWGSLPFTDLQVSTTGNEKVFYIKSNQTYSNNCRYFMNATTGVATEIADYGKFAFYAVNGVTNGYYIKECTTNKWLTYDNTSINSGKDFVKMSDTQGNYFIVQKNKMYYWIRPVNASGNADNYCNWNGGPQTYSATNTLGLYNSYDDKGSQWIFCEPEDVITSLEEITNTKCYNLVPARGEVFASTDGTKIVPIQNAAANTAAGADQWALLTYDGQSYYPYNILTKTFLKGDGTLGELPEQPFTLSKLASPVGVFQFMLKYGSNTLNHNGSDFVLNSWGTADDGNIIMISEAGDFDASNLDAIVTQAAAIELARFKDDIKAIIAPLSFLYNYENILTAIDAATSKAEVNTALAGFNNFFTAKNIANTKYLEVGEVRLGHNASPSNYSNYIQLVSAGNGAFYLKGYKSQRFAGDVPRSDTIKTTETANVPFYIQTVNGNFVMRPVKWANSGWDNGYHYIHAGGFDCVGWESSANASQYTLYEVADPDAVPIDVTYEAYFNGVKATETTVSTMLGMKAATPDALVRDYVDLVCENTYITSAGQKIRIDATWNGPFELNADYASISRWYDMAVRDTWYVTSDNKDGDGALKTVNANAMGLAEDAYQWAFVGDPWHIQLYNKAYGDSKVYAWTSNDNGSIPAFVDPTTTNYWKIRKSTSSIANSFMLTTDLSYQVNQFTGAGGPLKVWAATGTGDGGSAFTVFDVPDDFSEYAVAEILPYLETSGYYALTDAAKAEIGWDDSYSTSCPFAAYKAMKQTLQAKLADGSGVKKPGTGYYRLQSKYYPGKYMSYRIFDDNGTVVHSICAVDNSSDITSIVKLTSLGSNKYTLSIEGAYVPVPKTSKKMELADAPVEFTAINSHLGAAAFNTNNQEENKDRAIHCASTQDYYCVGWTYNAEASEWTLDDATTFSITMHAGESNYWATLYAPFGVTLPTGTEAYVGKINEGGNLQLTSIGQDVPAGTAVILCGDAESITATINDAIPAFTGENALQGQYLAADAADDTKLTLGKKDGKVGFYTIDSALGANKAYLTASAGAKGFQIVFSDDDITGIQEFENSEVRESECYYDLTGRKVAAPQKGQLYIVNGKVVKY